MRIQVKDFMSSPVITATKETSVQEVRALFKENGIHAILVVSGSEDNLSQEVTIRGIITLTDISEELNHNSTVEELMTSSSVHVVHTETGAQSAAKMMLKHQVHHLVAMDDGKIRGMISSLDFVKLVAEHALE